MPHRVGLTAAQKKKLGLTKDGRVPKRVMKKAAKALGEAIQKREELGIPPVTLVRRKDEEKRYGFQPGVKVYEVKRTETPARLDTPFSKEEMEIGKQIMKAAIKGKKPKEKFIKQEDCAHGTCPICGWSGPDGQGVYHEFDCPWVDDQMSVLDDSDERRYLMCTQWRGTETETVYPDGTRKPI